MKFSLFTAINAFLLPSLTLAVAPTDEYQDADPSQSGYLPSHNVDPSALGSYGHLWTSTFNSLELFLAKPLTYTPNGYTSELVIVVSSQNNVRVLDGLTGKALYSRTLDPPFLATDAQCGDIQNTIGIIGTPIIDPATDIMYFFSKGYKGGASGGGALAGQYKMYAVKLPALTDIPGYPVIIDGHYANNDPTRYFVGGTVLQRPGLAMVGDSIIGGFGGHCDNFNFTGMLVAVSKTKGVVTNIQAMVASPGAPSPPSLDINKQTGGKAGIWQGGMGLAVNGNNVYVVTGNGVGPGVNKKQGVANNGKVYCNTLEQVVARFAVDPTTGSLTQKDYFEPYNFDTQLNGGDRDFGSSGVALLDRGVFSAPNAGINGIAVASGKNGIVYIMDADNLGGFYNGVGFPDATLQQIGPLTTGGFYGGVASYPLEGGYLYLCPAGGPLYAYKYGLNQTNGRPLFSFAGSGGSGLACNGNPIITSNNGKPGSGVVWIADVNNGLVAFSAVPVNGQLQPLNLGWSTGRLTKFQRPVFGNSRVFTSENNLIYGIGLKAGTVNPPVAPKSSSTLSSKSSSSTAVRPSSTSSNNVVSTRATSQSMSTSVSKSKVLTPATSPTKSTAKPIATVTTQIIQPSPAAVLTTNPRGLLRTYNWNITWVRASPDGFARPFVGVNGQWPCPQIMASVGDTIKINVVNSLFNQTTAIHFHGLFQENSTLNDGPVGVTQCPIPPGGTFVYQFTVRQSGTYWYHAHVGGQYVDGFRGPLIIRDNLALQKYGAIDQQLTLSISDLYHYEAPYLINYYLSAKNFAGTEPVPNSALINEGKNIQIPITPGKTYMFYIVNMGAIAGQFVQFDQHKMTIIEADGTWVQPYTVDQLFVAVAQRYTVLVTAKTTTTRNFAIVTQFMTGMFDSTAIPAGQQPTCTGWLVYNPALPMPAPFALQPQPWDDTSLVPFDKEPLWDSNNIHYVYFTVDFAQNSWGSTRAMVNGQTYTPPKVPTFFTAFTAPSAYINNPAIYGLVNPNIIPLDAVVEIAINNHDSRAHPFHLHGHQFQIVSRAGNEPQWPGLYSTPASPMRRDTLVVYPGVGATIRFKANNPGIWLFHCHTEFHVEAGMTATLIEAPDVMVARKPYLPVSHKLACDSQSIPQTGNAAGNGKNWLDMTGLATESNPQYYGAMIKPPASNPYTGGAA